MKQALLEKVEEINHMITWQTYPTWPLRCSLSVQEVAHLKEIVDECKNILGEENGNLHLPLV